MFKAIGQFFLTFFTLFKALNRVANAIDKVAESAEDTATAFRDENKLNLRAKRADLEKRLDEAPAVTKTSADFDL